MKILAVDTSTRVGAVGFLDTESGASAEVNISIGQTHSQRLLGAIDYLLGVVECPLREVDTLAVSTGPGSFTGLRIGISIMQGLALAEGKKLTAFSSLEALAFNYAGCSHPICPMIDARRSEVYCGLYRFEGMKLIEEAVERVAPAAEFVRLTSDAETVFLGDGAIAYSDIIERGMNCRFVIPAEQNAHVRGASIVRLVEAMCPLAIDPGDIRPRYLRKSDAELAKRKPRVPTHGCRVDR
ncbi:MAG: tRNA (adenosine(37)-N6)-threonylcarbamoyltransferase complex dimerization subunit type 1 TsaB [Candidatus Coatesbacteria bacterium]|nr:tRNA (adenosine(37)-N6)-threonylcarbamoyltransferase complex dimerization subunit type 1 TsaB [Candidatus Coatesbacteria bacterium]